MNIADLEERLCYLSENNNYPGHIKETTGAELFKPFLASGELDENMVMDPKQNISFTVHPCLVEVPKHHHSFIELVYVYSGNCRQTINGKEITMKTGEICILDTNVSHSLKETARGEWIVNCLMKKRYFDTAFLGRLSGNDVLSGFFTQSIYQSKDFNQFILFHSGENEKVKQIMRDVLCEFYEPGLCSEEVINSYMILLFSELLRIYKEDLQNVSRQNLRNATITDIITYIQQHYQTATLKSTAKHFHFHPNYLSNVIKKLTGLNFLEILHEIKLKNASLLLANSDLPMRDICHEVGYRNVSFFYKLFKSVYGVTPAVYRKSLQPGERQ